MISNISLLPCIVALHVKWYIKKNALYLTESVNEKICKKMNTSVCYYTISHTHPPEIWNWICRTLSKKYFIKWIHNLFSLRKTGSKRRFVTLRFIFIYKWYWWCSDDGSVFNNSRKMHTKKILSKRPSMAWRELLKMQIEFTWSAWIFSVQWFSVENEFSLFRAI